MAPPCNMIRAGANPSLRWPPEAYGAAYIRIERVTVNTATDRRRSQLARRFCHEWGASFVAGLSRRLTC